MTKDEALKLALEALEKKAGSWGVGQEALNKAAITAIKEALAQPEQGPVEDVVAYHSDGTRTVRIAPKRPSEQEPVALVVSTAPDRIWLDLGFDPQDEYEVIFHELHDVTWSQDNASGNGIEYVRADTTPPKRPWVGLTDEEISQLWISTSPYFNEDDFAKAIEAKLKEKNT